MNTFRRLIGLLLILFLGLPLMFGIVWAVGLTKAAVSPEFLSEFPQKVISEIPVLVEEVFEEGQKQSVISDPNTRAWFEAAAKVEISPRELLRRIGLEDWMDHELSGLFEDVEAMLRGRRRVRTLVFDLRPLKEALLHEDFYRYIEEVVSNLPPCDETDEWRWERSWRRDHDWFSRKACRPDPATLASLFEDMKESIEFDIPDDVSLFEDVHVFPLGISQAVTWLSYFLFFLPAIVLFLAALIAATSPASFFRWAGISVFFGGITPFFSSLFIKYIAHWAFYFHPYADSWSSDLQNLIIDKTDWIYRSLIDFLFSPVIHVAAVVCGVGIILFAISLFVKSGGSSGSKLQPVTPAVQNTHSAESEPKQDFQREIPGSSETEGNGDMEADA